MPTAAHRCGLVRHELANLPFTPGKLFGGDRATEQLVNEPHTVGVEHVTFAIPRHLLYLTRQNHFLHATAVNSLGLAGQPE